jgi:integrase
MKGRLFKRVGKKRYRLPDKSVILKLFASMDELKFRPDAYRMFLLAIGAGLRRGEIVHLEKSWLRAGDPPTILIGETDAWRQKHGGEDVTEMCPWAFEELCRILPENGTRVLEGDERAVAATSQWLCGWLRSKGLDREHPVHELRMLCGCWIANRRGLYVAQKLLRHTSAQITSDHYADFVPDPMVLACWDGVLSAKAG